MARSSIWFNGVRLRKAMSSSFRPAPSTLWAPASCSPRFQQRSDTTFRLFDYGRDRELHIDNGVAVANAWPLRPPRDPVGLTPERTVLVASQHFVLERLELPAGSSWAFDGRFWKPGVPRARRPCGDRIGRAIDRAGGLRRWRPRQHRSRCHRAERFGRVSRKRSDRPLFCTGSPGNRPDLFSPLPPNWRSSPRHTHDAAPQDRGDRQFVAPPLRYRNIFDRPAARGLQFGAKPANLHRGDDRPRPDL